MHKIELIGKEMNVLTGRELKSRLKTDLSVGDYLKVAR